jgi:hypothetical protein
VIKVSAVLVAVALAVLVSGVVAGSLAVVYVSIGLSALSALLLAAGVVRQRAAVFGEPVVAASKSADSALRPMDT